MDKALEPRRKGHRLHTGPPDGIDEPVADRDPSARNLTAVVVHGDDEVGTGNE
jgi:hypothetical protein